MRLRADRSGRQPKTEKISVKLTAAHRDKLQTLCLVLRTTITDIITQLLDLVDESGHIVTSSQVLTESTDISNIESETESRIRKV